jgi:hypothetical protein
VKFVTGEFILPPKLEANPPYIFQAVYIAVCIYNVHGYTNNCRRHCKFSFPPKALQIFIPAKGTAKTLAIIFKPSKQRIYKYDTTKRVRIPARVAAKQN